MIFYYYNSIYYFPETPLLVKCDHNIGIFRFKKRFQDQMGSNDIIYYGIATN
jgi:hypothetical protein